VDRNKRIFQRLRHRIQCEILCNGQSRAGLVVDLSARGVFVRTSSIAAPPAGTEVRLVLKDTAEGDLTILARVARANVVRRELTTDARGGIGLLVVSAPEAYYALLRPLVRD
jgi:predicted FMN-binding regulatory protein PaiB